MREFILSFENKFVLPTETERYELLHLSSSREEASTKLIVHGIRYLSVDIDVVLILQKRRLVVKFQLPRIREGIKLLTYGRLKNTFPKDINDILIIEENDKNDKYVERVRLAMTATNFKRFKTLKSLF